MKKKLNIGFGLEIFYPEINGVITTTMNLIKNLKSLGHKPFIITPKIYNNMPTVISGIPVYYIPSITMRFMHFGPKLYPGLRRISKISRIAMKNIFKKHNCDIVHVTAPWLTNKGMLRVAKKMHIPRIQTFHTNVYDEKYIRYLLPKNASIQIVDFMRKLIWRAVRTYIDLSDVVTTPGPTVLQALSEVYYHKEIILMPNGVDISLFQKEDKKTIERIAPNLNINNTKYAIFIGRMGKEKSIEILIQAFVKIVKKYPKFLLLLIGVGPAINEYKKLAQDLKVLKNIKFLGSIDTDELLSCGIIKKAQFFTSASTTEVQSMTVIESICANTPMVLANHMSMTGLAKKAALYATAHDANSFANKMLMMIQDKKIRNNCKKEALVLSKQFDGKMVAQKFVKLYNRFIS